LGGTGYDSGNSIAVDSSGNAYITGLASSTDFPTTIGAFQTVLAGSNNAFISKFMFAPPASPIFPPRNAAGVQKKNRFLTQTEYRNIITWQAPVEGNAPVAYRIYRNSQLTQFITVVSAQAPLIYIEHNVIKKKPYTYYIVSVDEFGNSSLAAPVTVN
jgi:Beta-propeller repeat.